MLFLSSTKASSTLEIKGIMYGRISKIVYCLDTLQIKGLIKGGEKSPNKLVSVSKCKDEILEKCKNLGIKVKYEPIKMDTYTEDILKEQYITHKNYYNIRKASADRLNIKIRFPSIPEDISENIIKFILHYKRNDKTSSWACSKGDLYSKIEGVQECKCFTSDGPLSFTPSGEWDVIYFLDARVWLDDKFVLYRVNLKKSSNEWKNIKVNKKQTFEEQCLQGRRPHINWEGIQPQIIDHSEKVFEGSFEDIFN
jgi:hypothetical protein